MKKIFPIVASIAILAIILSFGYFAIFRPNKQKTEQLLTQEQQVSSENFQEQFQALEEEFNSKFQEQEKRIVALENRQNTTDSTFRKMRNAIVSYIAKDVDVADLREKILDILKIF